MGTQVEIHLFVKGGIGMQNEGCRNPDLVFRDSNPDDRAKPASDLCGTKAKLLRQSEFCELIIREWLSHCVPDGSDLPLLLPD